MLIFPSYERNLLLHAKSPRELLSRAFLNNPGDFLLSHAVARAVPSAPAGLTSVFGMGTGVTLPTKSPEKWCDFEFRIANCEFRLAQLQLP
jgi:hypothetical protein